MAQAQIPTRKRANGNELEGNGRSKRPRLPLFEEQKVHQLKGELSELRAYAEDSELLLSRTEQTLALLRRDMEMRAQLFSQEIRDLKLTINSSLCTVSPPDSPSSAPSNETPPIEVLRNSVPLRSSQPTTIPPPTTAPLSVDNEFDRGLSRNKMLSGFPSLNGMVNLNGLDPNLNAMNLHNFGNLKSSGGNNKVSNNKSPSKTTNKNPNQDVELTMRTQIPMNLEARAIFFPAPATTQPLARGPVFLPVRLLFFDIGYLTISKVLTQVKKKKKNLLKKLG